MNSKYEFDKKKHLHTLGGVALTGTSSVVSVIAKPLTWWASGKAVEAMGWINPKNATKEEQLKKAASMLDEIKSLDVNEYSKLLNKSYRNFNEFTKDAADTGVDLHSTLEAWVQSFLDGKEITPIDRIVPFVEWFKKNVKTVLWTEKHCYSETMFTGGISDLGVELNDGTYAIIDYKSSKEAYLSQFIQVAGYGLQIEENGVFSPKGTFIWKPSREFTQYIIVPFGAKNILPVVMRGTERFKEGFKSSLILYRLMNNYEE